jgi:branched-chain amino acid aminotransferase
MINITSPYYYKDGIFYDRSYLNPAIFDGGLVLYEVIRINFGVAVFLEDHIQRLEQSARLSGIHFPLELNRLRQILSELMLKNDLLNGNVKIILHKIPDSSGSMYTFFIPHFYPDDAQYLTGVDTDLFKAERSEPNIKKMHVLMVQQSSDFILKRNIYDALLVDEHDCITEGSKTNVFFVRGKILYTAPSDRVLKGITRQKLVELCAGMGIKLIENAIPVKTMASFDAAFFTGTSPKVLPIRRIADTTLQVSNPVMRKLMKAYDDLMISYISGKSVV